MAALVPPRVDGILSHEVMRQPVGPGGRLHALELPGQPAGAQAGSALAAGCSVVIKPAEETPAAA
jgi:succinate-semialdehyde dehydrogenase/glutarate-semialdehyde dehydrogenase